ncbi:hypothetical protein [Streptomyces profundus]|uniref:hypothetical protein n=1 Tax=Streptomyces profundus TaxID=2867410 RepID=UPI001D16BCEC|nr:hypothetical protein [Streptomyces sp. MA3_2.13]UED88803.1 hypothetical protein K4G22_01660 [Streptomyces sp. MA3_2.13]
MAHITGEHAPDSVAPPISEPLVEVGAERSAGDAEPRGCLFAVSQPPLMLFLLVICALLLIAGVHDQFWL